MLKASVRRSNTGAIKNIRDGLTGPSTVKVGFPAGNVGSDVISIAIWNHFGTSRGIPPRPFLANAMRDNKSKYRSIMVKAAKSILTSGTTLKATLDKLGILAQGDVQAEITALRTPPNAPSTIKQKGSSNPLIDTGTMRGAVTWKVDE